MNGLNYDTFDFCDFTDICLNCDLFDFSDFPDGTGNLIFQTKHLSSQNHISHPNHKNHSSDNYDATLASYGTRHPRLTGRDTRVLCDATLASCGTRYKSRNELIKYDK
jgi:hypothetical protein